MNGPPGKEEARIAIERSGLSKANADSLCDFERLQGRFDTRRITLARLPSGEFLAHQGSWCRVLSNIEAAHSFARLVGV